MSIRGDLEAPLWAMVGRDSARKIVADFFAFFSTADIFSYLHSQDYSDEQILQFLEILDVVRNKCLTDAPTSP